MPHDHRRPARSAPIARARTCYDHLAGMLGVGIFDALTQAGAIRPPPVIQGDIVVRPAAAEVFGRLGVDLSRVARGRRRYAYGCRDWTEAASSNPISTMTMRSFL